jgi:NAD-dependent DNA ligase
LDKKELSEIDVACMDLLIQISQILYDNTDRTFLVLDDGVYDLLFERDKAYNKEFQVGAPPIKFSDTGEVISQEGISSPMVFMDDPEGYFDHELFYDNIGRPQPLYPQLWDRPVDRNTGILVEKKSLSVPHKYPKLVGTLDKCKFTLNKEAKDRGVLEDRDIVIFERDFLGKHLQMGLFGPNDEIELVLELKYDGMSVEADVTDHIISARSRGDTNADLAADLTPILGGYRFPFCPDIKDGSIGMKFEAIITNINLDKLGQLKGKSYKNNRNAIVGLMGSLDAYDYRDLITLVPLATSLDMDRVQEIEFMNMYYHSGEQLRYAVVRGNYVSLLYQVYKFVQEAYQLRPKAPFMYDGVVVSYRDPKIIAALGRENSVNKYSIAIKFNPMVKQAVFTGYSFTIGQNGIVTPMIHYTPVEFYGTIHTKSTGHSYARFKELNLAIGDMLDVEYRNDVMPYVTKSETQPVWKAHNIPIEFPQHCPCCGEPLEFSDKSAICTNYKCPERVNARMANMMQKLNLKDFSNESIRAININNLHDMFNATRETVSALGEVNAKKFIDRVEELRVSPIYDYQIIGSLGFSNIAIGTWKKILNQITPRYILSMDFNTLYDTLIRIKGIGSNTAMTIALEIDFFENDLECILSEMPNVIYTYGMKYGKKIRFSGIRDQELCEYLNSAGMDANGNASITKDTDILIVPYEGYTSTKTAKAGPSTTIVPIDTFKANMERYL